MAYAIKNPKLKEKQTYSVSKLKLESQGYQDGEWANQFYVYNFKDQEGEDVELSIDVSTNEYSRYRVVYGGAVDFDGNNKKDLLKRYPEFKNLLK